MIVSYAKPLSNLAKEGAKIAKEKGIDCGKMCGECACKWDQERNLFYFMAADNAAKILIEGGEFSCHTHNYKCADKPCSGFLMAKLAYDEKNKIENKDVSQPLPAGSGNKKQLAK